MTTEQLLTHCFLHFFHLDHSNSAIHCAPAVRYSPITFRLAEELTARNNAHGVDALEEVVMVMRDQGAYEEDSGR